MKNRKLFIVPLVQILFAASFAMLYLALRELNMFPEKYIGIGLVGVLILFIITLVSQLIPKRIWGVFSAGTVLLSGVMIFGALTVSQATETLEQISAPKEYFDEVVVLVKNDSGIDSVEDLDGLSVCVQNRLQPELMNAAINKVKIKNDINFTVVECISFSKQLTMLEEGSVDAMLYNRAYEEIIEESTPDFMSNLKTLAVLEVYESDLNEYADQTIVMPTKPIAPTESTEPTEPAEVQSNTFIVYISGIDSTGSIKKKGRSDVNMLVVVNPDTKKILLVNTPRDYFVKIPGISGDARDKLTHAGIYGVQYSMATLAELYDVDIDYYCRVNFTSFEEIVDALGGITVYSDYAFSSRGSTFKKGENKMNGIEALRFSRERKAFPGGDKQRGKNQQAVIKGMIKKACSPQIIISANQILKSVGANVDMNIPEELIQKLIKEQLDSGTDWEVLTVSATGSHSNAEPFSTPSHSAYVMEPNLESIEEAKAAIRELY